MADVTQVPANVRLVSEDTDEPKVQFGEGIVPGDWLRYNSTTDKHTKAQNDNGIADAGVVGMSLAYGADGTYGHIARNGAEVNVGATLTQAQAYYLSHNSAKMCPEGDVSTGRQLTALGVGLANGNLVIDINATGVAKP